MEKLLLSVQEVAGVLGIGRSEAYTLVHSEGFPTVKLGRRLLVSADRLRVWVEERAKEEGGYED